MLFYTLIGYHYKGTEQFGYVAITRLLLERLYRIDSRGRKKYKNCCTNDDDQDLFVYRESQTISH